MNNTLPKANSIAISKATDGMASHLKEIQESAKKTRASVIYVSCENFGGQNSEVISTELVKDILKQLQYRTEVSWINIFVWFKYRAANKKFAQLTKEINDKKTAEQVQSFLSHYNSEIKEQVKILIKREKQDFALLVITHFHLVPSNDQPVIAGLIHKLIKGTPMYFRILSVGEPVVFRKDEKGEVGIQRNHDYTEIRSN